MARRTGHSQTSLRLPAVTDFDMSPARRRQWDSIITAHVQSKTAHTWRLDRLCIGAHALPCSDKMAVTAVCLSTDGHFAFVGSEGGVIDRYNAQSGLHRGTYGGQLAHKQRVTALATDLLGHTLVSTSLDVRFAVVPNALILAGSHSAVGPCAASRASRC